MTSGPIFCFNVAHDIRIYRIPVQAFAMLVANVYVVIAGDYAALIDTGSGIHPSNEHLQVGMAALRSEWGETLDWADIKRVVVTHAHIDHHGGLGLVTTQTSAPIAVHELDRRVLTNHAERLTMTSRALHAFLQRAGVSEQSSAEMLQMYGISKDLFRSVEVETVLHDGDMLDGLFHVHHTPGHCPGQVCLQIEDVLLCADHVLPRTSPHLAPESITPSTGLDHYLQGLQKIAAVPDIRLALGGHEEPIEDFYGRIGAIQASHRRKLDRIYAACAEPHTIKELTQLIYPRVQGYDILLALEEVGAHIEYLDQRGELAVDNLDEVVNDEHAAPRYRQL